MFDKFIISHKLKYFFLEKKIHSLKFQFPKILKIKFFNWGYRIYLDLEKICSADDILINFNYLLTLFRAIEIELIENYKGFFVFDVLTIDILDLDYKNINLKNYELLLGYDFRSDPVFIDIKKNPHLAIQGLSNTGKTKMVECMLLNLDKRNYNIFILNNFDDDFKNINCKKIIDLKEIELFLTNLLTINCMQRLITLIVIDEINQLSLNKNINLLIENLLQVSRHYNIYLICIGQILLKENIKYKQLFNSRVSFKQIDKSVYSSFLNCNIDNLKELFDREFYIFAETLKKCKTYSLAEL